MPLSRRQLLTALGALACPAPATAERPDDFLLIERVIEVPGLDPAHDGLRVAHLTDLHVGDVTPDSRIIAAVRAVGAASPDLVVLTGDYVTASKGPVPRLGYLLAGLQIPAFAVLGNHDHWVDAAGIQRELEQAGYAVLRNQATAARLRGVDLWVVGVDDGRTRRDDVEASFGGVPATASRIVLAHTPPTARKLPAWAGLVCLSGHTHGGQIRIPGFTDNVLSRAGQPYVRGLYRVRGNLLYVNAGLGYGAGGPMFRVANPPEVALLTLRRAA